MDTHVQRGQPIDEDSFQVGFGESGQGREVSVQKAQPIIVIFEIQALSHSRRQLIDEAKGTVIVTGSHSIEDCARDFDSKSLPFGLFNGELVSQSASIDFYLDRCRIGEHSPFDDVSWDETIDRKDLVTCEDPLSFGHRAR